MTSQKNQLAINGGKAVRTEPMPIRRLFAKEEKAVAQQIVIDKSMYLTGIKRFTKMYKTGQNRY